MKISAALLAKLAKIDNIVGIKDSSGDLTLTTEYLSSVPEDFSIVMGRDTLIFSGLLHGAKGAIAATANVVPALVVSIYECFKQNDLKASLKAQEALAPLRMAFTWGTFPVVIKEALDLIGLQGGPSRAPVGPMTPAQRERLKNLLMDLNMIQ